MILAHSLEELASCLPNVPVHWAMGFFDGVHRGHERVVCAAVAPGALRGVLTFSKHPLAVLAPERAPKLLTPHAGHKAQLLDRCGVDVLLELPFTRELAALPPQEFLARLAAATPGGVAGFSVGENWRFGRGGAGDAGVLHRWGAEHGCTVCVNLLLQEGGMAVSSSRIRRELAEGHLREVEQLLGHPFCMCGRVEEGQQLARKLGFPTANITLPANAALPPMGVYHVVVFWGEHVRHGVANLGYRPTIEESHKPVRLEVHLLGGWKGDLYGQELCVELRDFLRPERRFESLEALRAQLQVDVEMTRSLFPRVA